MAQILVRNLDQETVDKLKEQARLHGRSLQQEAKRLIEEAANEPRLNNETALKQIKEVRKLFKGKKFPDSVKLIREDRDR